MVQHPAQQTAHTVLKGKANKSDVLLFRSTLSGFGVFEWTMEVEAWQEKQGAEQWLVTVRIMAREGSTAQVFLSGIGRTVLGGTAAVPFPTVFDKSIASDSYGLGAISAQYKDGESLIPQTIGIYLKDTSIGISISIVNTEITPTWIIGARDISLIDDEPVGGMNKEVRMEREEESIVG